MVMLMEGVFSFGSRASFFLCAFLSLFPFLVRSLSLGLCTSILFLPFPFPTPLFHYLHTSFFGLSLS